MEEIWKDIHNYEKYYQVSDSGKIRSLNRYVKDSRKTQFIKGKYKIKGKVSWMELYERC